ncbi:testis-expressed sequence 2 protein [Tanacetum coccineum]
MRVDEIHKFCDGTLQFVHNINRQRLQNFRLGYNNDMPSRQWTNKDKRRTCIMLNKIDDQLLKRRIMRSLEVLVGGRKIETNKRLLQRTASPLYVQKAFDNRCTYAGGAFPKDENIKNIRVMLHSIHNNDRNTSANIKQALWQIVTNRFILIVLSALRRSSKENKQVRSVLIEPEVHIKMEMEIPCSSKVKFITACSYSVNKYKGMMKAQVHATQVFRYSDTQKIFLEVIKKLAEKNVERDGVKAVEKSGSDDVQFSFPNKQVFLEAVPLSLGRGVTVYIPLPPYLALVGLGTVVVVVVSCLGRHGWVWILEKEKIPKTSSSPDKAPRQQKRKIEIVEVSPVRKHANVKDKSLIVTELDGSLTNISLKGCIVEAVSATNLPSRKWAKKYPIKVENKSSVIYHGNKFFYIYFETSSEKESWCTALRLASCDDKDKLIWFYRLRSEFHSYLASLNVEYPSFLKPSIGFNPETGDKSIKIDGSSNKVRHFLKKLAKKTSKVGRDDKRFGENSVGGGSGKPPAAQTGKKAEEIAQGSTPRSISSGSGSRSSDADINDKVTTDDGTLCFSLLISRLFFDAKSNVDLRNSIRARIQRTLSTIRTPSYIGEILCTSVHPGNVPPYIHGMRVLPSDLKEVVVMEIDIEYYGGAVLDIETRLEVQELENTESSDSTSVNEVTSDLLEGVMKLNEQTNQPTEPKGDEVRKLEETKSFKNNEQGSSTVPKWKSVLNSVAKQVSQLPLALAIRITTLRGTLRVHIKPPPSDQIWFGFTSMPDIDFSLESSVGDHKITSGHIALFIINKFKAAIRESMVLPNSESVTIPFMLAEKNDWIPQKSAPFIWINPEATPEPTTRPTAEPNTKPATKPATEPSTKPATEPSTKPATKPANDPTTKPATEPTTKPATKPTNEPITKPTAEPMAKPPTKPTVIHAARHVESHPQEPQEGGTSSKRSTESSTSDKTTHSLDDEKFAESDEKTPFLDTEEHPPTPHDMAVVVRKSVEDNQEVIFPTWQQPSPPQAMVVATNEENNDTIEADNDSLRRMGTKAKMLGFRKKLGEKLEEKRRNIEEKGRHIAEKMRGPGGI